jgi:CrcB protein
MDFLLVMIGGGLGAGLRHGTNLVAARLFGTAFPYGTLTVNIVGSALIGLLYGMFATHAEWSHPLYLFLTAGLLGGYTTFSAFSLDIALLHERSANWLAALYVALSVIAGIAGLFAAMLAARYLF